MIYHIVKEKDYLTQAKRNSYIPDNIDEFGFVHCAPETAVIAAANDFYSNVNDKLIVLKIDPMKLRSEISNEAAVPLKSHGTKHITSTTLFPHVYGPIDNSAVEGIGVPIKRKNRYEWPDEFVLPADYISK